MKFTKAHITVALIALLAAVGLSIAVGDVFFTQVVSVILSVVFIFTGLQNFPPTFAKTAFTVGLVMFAGSLVLELFGVFGKAPEPMTFLPVIMLGVAIVPWFFVQEKDSKSLPA